MFYEEGWAPLSEVTAEVFRKLQALKAAGDLEGSLKGTLAVSVWEVCDACTKVGVTAEDGSVIPATKDLVAWADPLGLSNEHVNVRFGTVGSTTLKGEDGKLPGQAELIARYGPFLNLPIVIPVNNFQSSMTFLADEVKAQSFRDEAVVAAARTILQMAKDGLVTRETATEKLGASLSRRKFKLAWAIAAKQVPELAEPNRWAGL